MRRVMVIAAHPDDEILGCGGTIRKYIDSGDSAQCVILGEGLTSRQDNRDDTDEACLEGLKNQAKSAARTVGYSEVFFNDFPDNRFDSMSILNITRTIEKHIERFRPDIVYTHHYGDLNKDHRLTFEAVITACRPVGEYSVKEIYCFETPSSTEWNFKYGENSFKPNVFIDIEDTISMKLEALKCYKSEIREFPHPRSIKGLEVIAERWGLVVGRRYVEAFELIRKVQ
ncbi:MAG: PIG-L deacetylase family protein [Bacillota bacterium]|nr:PIG-L deacetylase family protein [Bacillota bacterium]